MAAQSSTKVQGSLYDKGFQELDPERDLLTGGGRCVLCNLWISYMGKDRDREPEMMYVCVAVCVCARGIEFVRARTRMYARACVSRA